MKFGKSTFLASETPELFPKKLIEIAGQDITETVFSALVVSVLIILLALFVRIFCIPKWNKTDKSSGFRIFIEWIVSIFDKTAHSTVGHNANVIGPWYFAVAAFVCIGTLIEMAGLRPPTSDLNATLVLGLLTFLLIQIYGIKEKKVDRFGRYFFRVKKVPVFPNPINLVTDAIVPFSMALRMYGSVFSGFLIMHMLYGVLSSVTPFITIGIPIIGNLIFTAFHALIQAYVFMILSMNFIAEATE